MGIYADIQSDIKEAMDDDLADAVAELTITESSNKTYDPVGGTPSDTPIVSTMRCIIVDADLSDEIKPDSDTSTNDIEVMVLDSERLVTFAVGLDASVRNEDYFVMRHKVDPAGATHTLTLRRR